MAVDESEHQVDESLEKGLHYFFNHIPFNKLLGLELAYVGRDRIEVKLFSRPDLVGNYMHGILHGGVVSSMLDVAGGLMSLVGAYERMRDTNHEKRMAVLSKVGTIDMRVDYLRPGKGRWFLASARVLRTGNKVAVTRMELHNDLDELLALGTGTYMCG